VSANHHFSPLLIQILHAADSRVLLTSPWTDTSLAASLVRTVANTQQEEKLSLLREIELTETSGLAPGCSETDLAQQLVLQFLQHDGYIETARAFAEEMQAEKRALTLEANAAGLKDINVKDDEDANRRQRIRRAILEGDIDRALKLTTAYYPQVLKENEQVYFRLRCRKFIEMIRKDADAKQHAEKPAATNGHNGNGVSVQDQTRDDQSMELDGSSAWEVQMDDTDDGAEDGLLSTDNGAQNRVDGVAQAIEYGRELRAEFGGDQNREVEKYLDEIFSLVAFPDPWRQPEVAHLLDRSGRVAVAEELNSAVLRKLVESPCLEVRTIITNQKPPQAH
jgi:Ran-binding protein 9/10